MISRRLQSCTIALCAIALTAFLAAPHVAHAQNTPPAPPAPTPVEPADIAAPKLTKDGKLEPRFQQLHEEFLKRGKAGPIGVLFLGASIMERWQTVGKEVWDARYGKDDPADFGVSGDKTQNVLWRIDNGELDGIAPKVVVVMVGSNNLGIGPEDALIRAEIKIVEEIHRKLPNTKVLSLGVFPHGAHPTNTQTAKYRAESRAIYAALSKLDDGNKTRVLDIGDKFTDAQGILTKEIMPDQLHPTKLGYEIWANAIQSTLDEMLK
jgi:beta-glucosidase